MALNISQVLSYYDQHDTVLFTLSNGDYIKAQRSDVYVENGVVECYESDGSLTVFDEDDVMYTTFKSN